MDNYFENPDKPIEVTSNILKNKSKFTNLFDAINRRRDDTHVVEAVTPNKNTTQLIDESTNNSKPITTTSNILEDKPKSKFTNLFDAINARRDDSHVVEAVTPNTNVKSLIDSNDNQTKVENLASTALLDDIKKYDSNAVKPIKNITDTLTPDIDDSTKPKFSDLFKQIKNQRKEYGTPILETKEEILNQVDTLIQPEVIPTPKSALSVILDSVKGLISPKVETKTPISPVDNLFDDTNALFEDNDSNNIENQDNLTSVID
jgi:hypothetical protein